MKTELNELRVIKEFAVSLLSQNSLEDLLWDIAGNIGKLLSYEDCVIYLNINGMLEQWAAFGIKNPNPREIVDRIRIPVGQGIVGTVAATGLPELVRVTSEDPRYIPDLYCGMSEVAVPIVSEGKVIGVIDSENKLPNSYTQKDLEILQAIANIAASRIAAAMSQEEVARITDVGDKYKLLLENEREWSRTVLDSIQDGIIATDEEFRIVMASPVAQKLLGREPTEYKGKSLNEFFEFQKPLNLASSPLNDVADGRADLRQLDGSVVRVCYRVSPLRYDEDLIGRVVVFRDIAHEQFLEQEAEKAQRLESLGVLAGGIAHDFNNNIQSILSSLYALKIEAGFDSKMIDVAEKACMQSKALARQLLTFSKGGAPIRQATNTKDLLRRCVDLAMAGRTSLVKMEMPDSLSNVLVDRNQVEQVLGNLVINADQAMPNGGQITIAAKNAKLPSDPLVDCVEISICDHGVGIEESDLNRIFDPYFTTRSSGNGLGLTISYSIVNRHGGDIVVESAKGVGTTFKVSLPATNKELHPTEEHDDATISQSFKILLLDDEPLVLRSTQAILTQLGHQVESVSNREQAISVFTEHLDSARPFDLAILDLTIRGDVGGQEIGRQLLQIDPNLKMVVTSGYANEPVLRNFRDFGFSGFLQKPFSLKSLSRIMKMLIEDQAT